LEEGGAWTARTAKLVKQLGEAEVRADQAVLPDPELAG
jgi:hypothetical protein